MGRIIVADERVLKCIDDLQNTEESVVGLLIGQLTEQRDYVVHLVRTPEAESDKANTKKGGSLDVVNEGWITTHARQVLKMLPGGLDIVGVFAMGTQDAMKTAQLHLRKVLFAVQKMINKSEAGTGGTHGDRALLNICSLTKKVTCRTFDTADMKSAARPAEWRVQSLLGSWVAIESSLTVDHVISVSSSALSHTLSKQIHAGLAPLLASVRAGMATVDGQLRSAGDPVDTTPTQSQGGKRSAKGGKGHRSEVKEASKVTIHLLLQLPGGGSSDITVTPCGAQMRLCGTITSQAFVHGKATVREAIQAVKTDVIRSLTSRCDLLCEDLLQAEEEQDPRVLYETPVRIHGAVAGTPLCFCDYMFQDETATDSTDRFRDLLGLMLTEEELQMDVEHIPSETDVLVAEQTNKDTSQSQTKQPSTKDRARNLIGAAVGAAVAMLAAGVSYMYILED